MRLMGYALMYSTRAEHESLPWFILRGCAIVARFQTESAALTFIATASRAPRSQAIVTKICWN